VHFLFSFEFLEIFLSFLPLNSSLFLVKSQSKRISKDKIMQNREFSPVLPLLAAGVKRLIFGENTEHEKSCFFDTFLCFPKKYICFCRKHLQNNSFGSKLERLFDL